MRQVLIHLAVLGLVATVAAAQDAMPASAPAPAAIQMDFPETVEVKTLVDYVSKRMGMNILYDEALVKKRVTLSSPMRMPAESLPAVLQSVLRMSGLTMIDAEPAGWKKIVAASDVAAIGRKPAIRFVTVQHASAGELAKQVTALLTQREKIVAGSAKAATTVTLVPQERNNQIAVIADEGNDLDAVELIRTLDTPDAQPAASQIKFYKLTNSTAAAVLATVRSLMDDKAATAPNSSSESLAMKEPFSGPNNPPRGAGEPPVAPPVYRETPPAATSQPAPAAGAAGSKEAVVTADINTNTIIVIAPPAMQDMYKQLIERLDKRRPQVMLEVTLMTLDESESLSLGVELTKLQRIGDNRLLAFSSFGLSTVDTATGIPTIKPAAGFNGVLISPDGINVVVRALASTGKAKVLSAPKVLVNDNATATLSSVAEAPFTSVNASQTVSTTSFAGYASAGTTITVVPHISQGDHLQLQYSVTLNSFTGDIGGALPPPRQTNAINSEVTVPDGYAIIVGGLSRKNTSKTVTKIPLLGDIPILGYLFSSHQDNDHRTTLYAFIRPVILRDDQFEDLKYLSDRDLSAADLPVNLPASEPLILQ